MFQTPPAGQDYINETTLATFGVGTAAILAVSVVFRKVFSINHPIVPFITALAISFTLAVTQNQLARPVGWLIAFLNAALLFCAGVGANETAAELNQPKPTGGDQPQGKTKTPTPPQPFLKSFFSRDDEV
jgi:hypothetical protein